MTVRSFLTLAAIVLWSFTFSQEISASLMKPVNDMMARMRQVKMSGSFDADFAKLMSEHHQGVIDLSQAYLASGKNEQLKDHARQLIEKRKKEQKQLEIFTKARGPKGSHEMMAAMDRMMAGVKALRSTGDIDRDYATLMVAQHDSGIELANMESGRGENAALKKMALKIAEDQRHSRQVMQQWLGSSGK